MSKKKKNRFADAIIVCCLIVCVIITLSLIWEYHRLNTVIPASVLGVLFTMWGGELLVIALRQIFGSDIIAKIKKTNYNSEEGSI